MAHLLELAVLLRASLLELVERVRGGERLLLELESALRLQPCVLVRVAEAATVCDRPAARAQRRAAPGASRRGVITR